MSLAKRIRELREGKGLSLDEVAARAKISKTYLWELERDTAGEKKPSADVLLRIANALSSTIAHLMALPAVKSEASVVELPKPLQEFSARMEKLGTPLSKGDLHDLAVLKFRGGQPQTADEWHNLYLVLANSTRKQKK
jgi:transcriptional regulator with XRE-family HTH domain